MKLFDLQGKVAIVTGGSSGIGLGMARGLVEAGATVAIAARTLSRCEEAVEDVQQVAQNGGSAFAIGCDVTNMESVNATVSAVQARCGRIDILVNNAGTNIRKRPEETSYAEWQTVMRTNLDSAYLCSNACYPAMQDVGGGKILNNGSMLSLFGSAWAPAYAASKGGMVQLTKSLACAWAADNIQVNCFLPGFIDTPLTQQGRRDIPGLEEKVTARTPAARWGHIDDFRGIAVFLASPASNFVTGATITVDGGFSVNVV